MKSAKLTDEFEKKVGRPKPKPEREHSEYHGECVCGASIVTTKDQVRCPRCGRWAVMKVDLADYPMPMVNMVKCNWCGEWTSANEQPCRRHAGVGG